VGDRSALDVVIVSYRCEPLLRNCLASLRDFAPARPTRVFVVDNASRDGTGVMVRTEFPDVVFIEAEENLGFARANNLAIRQSRGDYVLALNPDTRVTEGALERLLDLMDDKPEVGICGCRLELEDGTLDHAAKRSFPTPLSALGHFSGIGRRNNAPAALAAYRAPEVEAGPVDAVNGAFMLMRRRALEEVGLFDEGYWMYMEDLDLCYRFKQAGWLTWYEPSATVVHVKAATSGKYRGARLNYAFHYGMYRFYRKHYAGRNNIFVNVGVYGGIGLKLVASLMRNALERRRPVRA
jgi:GT2 family glycosyltransferase